MRMYKGTGGISDLQSVAWRSVPSMEPPSLQALVVAHGTYDKIPQVAWRLFHTEMAEWQAKVRYGEFHVVDRTQTHPRRSPPQR